jgi:hypothetical protein
VRLSLKRGQGSWTGYVDEGFDSRRLASTGDVPWGSVPWSLTLQAVLHDAGTYDPIAKTGGLNGSLRYELNRVENKQLGAVIKQVEAAKAKIDASPLATAPISFSDTLALAGLVGWPEGCEMCVLCARGFSRLLRRRSLAQPLP